MVSVVYTLYNISYPIVTISMIFFIFWDIFESQFYAILSQKKIKLAKFYVFMITLVPMEVLVLRYCKKIFFLILHESPV